MYDIVEIQLNDFWYNVIIESSIKSTMILSSGLATQRMF